jgi:hypothetical protein
LRTRHSLRAAGLRPERVGDSRPRKRLETAPANARAMSRNVRIASRHGLAERRRAPHTRRSEERIPMLLLRPGCECCDADLPPDSLAARICSFECTFCASCAQDRLANLCPNCGGELVRRPIRPADKLVRNPASTERVFKPLGDAPA